MFELRVNDFDPDFEETCKALAESIEQILKKESIDESQDLHANVAKAVKKVVEDVSGTEAGQAKKRWKAF